MACGNRTAICNGVVRRVATAKNRVRNANGGGKAAATRTRLIDAAAKVLSQQGYAATRLNDVGDMAGVQGTAIYYHFSNKEDLIGEVFREGLIHARNYLLAALDDAPDANARERISIAIDAHLRMSEERRDYTAASTLKNSGDVPPSVQALCRQDERAYARLWKGLLLDAQSADVLNDDIDLVTAQAILLGALNSVVYSMRPGRVGLETAIKTAQTLILNGLCKPPS